MTDKQGEEGRPAGRKASEQAFMKIRPGSAASAWLRILFDATRLERQERVVRALGRGQASSSAWWRIARRRIPPLPHRQTTRASDRSWQAEVAAAAAADLLARITALGATGA